MLYKGNIMSQLKHVVKLGSLRNGYKTLANNVKHDIQYDHISLLADKYNIDIESIVTTYDVKRIINTAIANNKSIQEVYDGYCNSVKIIKAVLDTLEDSGVVEPQFMIAAKLRLGGSFYELNNPNHISLLKEKLVISSKIVTDFTHLLEARQTFSVPKNSDKASEEIRSFICKPVINEVIISSMLHANFRRIEDWKMAHSVPNLHVYGPRVTYKGEFVPYIFEYNLMTAQVSKLKEKASSIIAVDIKSYFSSIQIKHLTLMFNEIFKSSKEAQLLTSQLKFNYLNDSGVLCKHSDGLTIESNYQHYIANIFMEYVLSTFIKQHLTNRPHVENVEIVTYIDDLFFFITYDRNVSILLQDTINNEIYNDFKVYLSNLYQMELNHNKTKFINRSNGLYGNFSTKDNMGIKELIRLPTFNYIELINDSIKLTDDVFERSNVNISAEEWLKVLQEIVNAFEGPHRSLFWSIDKLSPIANRVVRTVLDMPKHKESNLVIKEEDEIHSKFISGYIIERLNQYQFERNIIPSNNSHAVRDYHIGRFNNSYHAYLLDSIDNLKSFMRADNIAFYIAHYDDFEYSDKFTNVAKAFRSNDSTINIQNYNSSEKDLDILKVLQYLYLCRTNNVSEVTNIIAICLDLITIFPNKSRFIAGIIKRQLTRIIKFSFCEEESVFKASSILYTITTLTSIKDKKYDYFRYSLNRMKF